VPKLAHLRQRARELGIRLHFLLIAGLPHETRSSIVDTYDLVMRHEPDTIGLTVITPYPGTPSTRRRNARLDRIGRLAGLGGHQVVMRTPHLSRDDLARAKQLIDGGWALFEHERRVGTSPEIARLRKEHYVELLGWAYGWTPFELRRSGRRERSRPRAAHRGDSHVQPARHPAEDLLAFSAQTVAPAEFEVVVVDDGSTDDTLATLAGCARRSRSASSPSRIAGRTRRGTAASPPPAAASPSSPATT